jgi:SAM-dependent methyltransferase
MELCCSRCGHIFNRDDRKCPKCGLEPTIAEAETGLTPEPSQAAEGYSPDYFEFMAEHEEGHFWFESRNRLLNWSLRKYFPDAGNLLEIGCGTGFVLRNFRKEFPSMHLVGTDLFLEGLAYARSGMTNAAFYQMDARDMPFKEEFDVVGIFDVLEHIEQDSDVLLQAHKSLRHGGGIIITVPQHPFLWSTRDETGFHKRRYTRKELTEKIHKAGFRIIRITSFVSCLMPLLLISRLKDRFFVKSFDPASEFRIGRFGNKVLEAALSAERAFIKKGLSLPFGGSLLLVAKKS